MICVVFGHAKVVEIFMNHPDFDINSPDSEGDTIAHYLTKTGIKRDIETIASMVLQDNDLNFSAETKVL
jgi:hypothetical protein